MTTDTTVRMPIICPLCGSTFAFDAYSKHRVILPEAPEGFICMAPDDDTPEATR